MPNKDKGVTSVSQCELMQESPSLLCQKKKSRAISLCRKIMIGMRLKVSKSSALTGKKGVSESMGWKE